MPQQQHFPLLVPSYTLVSAEVSGGGRGGHDEGMEVSGGGVGMLFPQGRHPGGTSRGVPTNDLGEGFVLPGRQQRLLAATVHGVVDVNADVMEVMALVVIIAA